MVRPGRRRKAGRRLKTVFAAVFDGVTMLCRMQYGTSYGHPCPQRQSAGDAQCAAPADGPYEGDGRTADRAGAQAGAGEVYSFGMGFCGI